MPLDNILQLLKAERDKLDRAISALVDEAPSIAASSPASEPAPATKDRRRQRTFTAEQRKALSDRMRASWKKRRAKGN